MDRICRVWRSMEPRYTQYQIKQTRTKVYTGSDPKKSNYPISLYGLTIESHKDYNVE